MGFGVQPSRYIKDHISPLVFIAKLVEPLFRCYSRIVERLRRIPLNVRAISAKNIYQKTTHSTVTF